MGTYFHTCKFEWGGQNFSFPTLFDSYRELLLRAQKLAKPKSRDLISIISDITDIVAYLCLSKYVIGFCSVLENNMEQPSVTTENFKQRKKCM